MSTPGRFVVEAVDLGDGSRTTLQECDSSAEAFDFLAGYIRTEDAGGWDLIEVYDLRGEPERLRYWDRP